eukprot:TRINITY_DN2468_c3_g2_i1.p1 TRINITY_DN2468_c3_g2~~TRINITY_DN2468_c3_g2_i1.p1  ORF type:complete len:1129 (+),score=404.32 TRINITY_DN2468_c3_g2_i1:100-3387(+)
MGPPADRPPQVMVRFDQGDEPTPAETPGQESQRKGRFGFGGGLAGSLADFARNSPRNVLGKMEAGLGQLAGDDEIDGGGPIRELEAPIKQKVAKQSVAGYVMEASWVHGFLRQIAALSVESPRQIEVYLYVAALLCFTVQIMLTVSTSRSTEIYNMNTAIKDALVHEEFLQDSSLRFRKSFEWIGEPEEVWQWLLGPILTAFWGPGGAGRWDSNSSGEDTVGTNYVRTYNQPVLAVLLRTLRVRNESCNRLGSIPDDLSAVLYQAPCQPQYSNGRLNGDPFGADSRWRTDDDKRALREQGVAVTWSGAAGAQVLSYGTQVFPLLTTTRARHYTYLSTGQVHTTPFFVEYQTRSAVERELHVMREGGWIDASSRLVMVETLLFNRNVRTFVHARLWVEIDAGGHMVPDARFRPFILYTLDTSTQLAMFVLDILVVCYYGYECFALLKRLWHIWIIRRDWTYMVTFWNMVTAVQIILVLWGYITKFQAYRLSGELDAEWGISEAANSDTWERLLLESDMGTRWERLVDYAVVFTEALDLHSVNACILWCRLLAFFQHVPRLSSLTDTVYRASGELMSVLLIACVVTMGYSLMATTLWGFDLLNYSSWGKTLMMLFRVGLDIGYFEFDAMYFLHPWLTVFFFCTFVFFMFVLIVNMLLAVITEAFVRAAHAKRAGNTGVSSQLLIKALIARGKRMVIKSWLTFWNKMPVPEEVKDKGADSSEDDDDDDLNIMGMDRDTQLLMNYRDTVRNTKHLQKLSAAINKLSHWMDRDSFISVEDLLAICPVQSKEDPTQPFLFNRRQWRVIEDLYRERGSKSGEEGEQPRNRPAPPRWAPLSTQGSGTDGWGGDEEEGAEGGDSGRTLPWMMSEAQEQIVAMRKYMKRFADEHTHHALLMERKFDAVLDHLGVDLSHVHAHHLHHTLSDMELQLEPRGRERRHSLPFNRFRSDGQGTTAVKTPPQLTVEPLDPGPALPHREAREPTPSPSTEQPQPVSPRTASPPHHSPTPPVPPSRLGRGRGTAAAAANGNGAPEAPVIAAASMRANGVGSAISHSGVRMPPILGAPRPPPLRQRAQQQQPQQGSPTANGYGSTRSRPSVTEF